MPLTRHSKIKEAWQHPVGHELLQSLLKQTGRSPRWLTLMGGLPLQTLDRFAPPGFCDMLIEMAAHEPDHPSHPDAEEQAWWKQVVVYRVYTPSFMDADHDGMGDFQGVIRRLPYLSRLGVGCLWLWPVLAGDGGGTTDYFDVDPELGTLEDFEALVEQAHARDIKVVLGMEVAFTSDHHPAFEKALEGEDDGYVLKPGGPDAPPNNWGGADGPVWRYYPGTKAWGLHLCGRHSMDLNWDSPAQREKMGDVLRFWQGKGVDGFHLGPVSTLNKVDYEDGNPAATQLTGVCGYEKFAYGPRLHRYLRELRAAVDAPVLMMGELDGVGTEMARLFACTDRAELDMVTDAGHLVAQPAARPKPRARAEEGQLSLPDFKRYYLNWMEQYGGSCWMSLFFETPFLPRIVSRLGASGMYRAILAKLLGTLMLTLRGTPVLYQGGELGLPNTKFTAGGELRDAASQRLYAELREQMGDAAALQAVLATAADHARVPMPWSAGVGAGFTGAQPWMRLLDGTEYLNATVQMEDAGSVWQHYHRLIALRNKMPCLVYGSFNPVFAKNKRVFCYFRIYDGEKWYVEMNLTEREVPRPGRILRTQKLAVSNYDGVARHLRPYEANLYRCE